tara:strand:- start:2231 stop:2941 length:711 start_codon:yes stop_codon:yes gene_type:complete
MNKNSEITQYKNIYQSTTDFEKFLKKNNAISKKTKNILDLGCGYGAQTDYFAQKFPKIDFSGWDYEAKAINFAKKNNSKKNMSFNLKDIFKIKKKKKFFDLIYSIHTFCVFKNIAEPLKKLCNLSPDFIAINSLFYDGPLDVLIHIRDYTNKKVRDNHVDSDFNIHSLQFTKAVFKSFGYKIVSVQEYFPKNEIKKKNNGRGSYTIKTSFNKNSTFSGPVYLPWHFVLAKKIKIKK